jgi:hypothetical protein
MKLYRDTNPEVSFGLRSTPLRAWEFGQLGLTEGQVLADRFCEETNMVGWRGLPESDCGAGPGGGSEAC